VAIMVQKRQKRQTLSTCDLCLCVCLHVHVVVNSVVMHVKKRSEETQETQVLHPDACVVHECERITVSWAYQHLDFSPDAINDASLSCFRAWLADVREQLQEMCVS